MHYISIVIGQLFTSIPLLQTQYLPTRPTTATTIPIQLFDEYALQLYMHERRLSLLVSPNDTHNPIFNYLQIYDHFRKDMEFNVYLCKKSLRKPKMIILFMDVYISGFNWSRCLHLGFVILAGL